VAKCVIECKRFRVKSIANKVWQYLQYCSINNHTFIHYNSGIMTENYACCTGASLKAAIFVLTVQQCQNSTGSILDRYADARCNSVNHPSTSYRNLVRFRPVIPEFTMLTRVILECVLVTFT